MKFLKKLWAKISGFTKYLVYMGKIIQTLKIIAGLMPQIAAMVKPDQQKTFGQIADVLSNIAGKMETTEKYLNDMGIATNLPDEGQARSHRKLTAKRAVKMLDEIDESL